MKKYLGVILLSLALFGCNSNVISEKLVSNLIKAPQVKDVSLQSFSIEDKSVVFDVSLYNPNIFPLPVSGLSGDFILNDIAIGSMAAKSDKILAASETQVVTLPIKLNTQGFIDAAKRAFTTQKASYQFNGGIKTTAGTLPFSKQGDLSVKDLMSSLLP